MLTEVFEHYVVKVVSINCDMSGDTIAAANILLEEFFD
jgi:hypothetical protein